MSEVEKLRAQVAQMREIVEAVANFDGRNNIAHLKQWARDVLASSEAPMSFNLTPKQVSFILYALRVAVTQPEGLRQVEAIEDALAAALRKP